MVKVLKKRTELLTVQENKVAASLSISSNTGYIDFNFSVRYDAKDSDNGSKKTENSRLAHDEVQEDTLPLAKIKKYWWKSTWSFSTTQWTVISPGETYS